MCRQIFDMAISAPVLPAEMAASALPFLTASMVKPHGRTAAAGAQGLARLVVVLHDHVGAGAVRDGGEPGY